MDNHTWTQCPSIQQWQNLKEEIRDLYARNPLKQVRTILEQRYGFRATDRMFKSRLSAWGFTKNSRDRDYQVCTKPHKTLRQRGKGSMFAIDGNKRSLRDSRKYIKGRKMSEDDFIALAEQNVWKDELEKNHSINRNDYPSNICLAEDGLVADDIWKEQQEIHGWPAPRVLEKESYLDYHWEDYVGKDFRTRSYEFNRLEAELRELSRTLDQVIEDWAWRSQFGHRFSDDVALTGFPSRCRKVLPMIFESKFNGKLAERQFDTLPDTGAHENAMDWTTCKTLGLELSASHVRKKFTLANGKNFKSMGEVDVICYFANDPKKVKHKLRFNIFSNLATPVIIGKQFLDQTETWTVNKHLLQTVKDSRDHVLKILHFNRPTCPLRCLVNGESVLVNADTGAEMNLVSPSFVAQLRRQNLASRAENLKVMLADGSIERITVSFEGNVSIGGSRLQTNITTRFYVLPGLTSDALIGSDTLDEADVFTKHLDAFADHHPGDDNDLGLNIIKWLSGKELFLLNMCNKKSTAPARGNTGTSSNTLPSSILGERSFRAALAEADARELHRREQADVRIAELSGHDKAVAQDAESVRVTTYDVERARCLALRNLRINAQQP